MASWNASETPPLDVEPRLLIICQCPGKDGPSVMRVVDKQLARVGLMRYDVKSMVGDGGAENEGMFKGMPLSRRRSMDTSAGDVWGTWHGEWQMQSLPKFLTTMRSKDFVNTYIKVSHGHVFKCSRPRPWSRMGWACSMRGREDSLRFLVQPLAPLSTAGQRAT